LTSSAETTSSTISGSSARPSRDSRHMDSGYRYGGATSLAPRRSIPQIALTLISRTESPYRPARREAISADPENLLALRGSTRSRKRL
jgi:hypothetical protein